MLFFSTFPSLGLCLNRSNRAPWGHWSFGAGGEFFSQWRSWVDSKKTPQILVNHWILILFEWNLPFATSWLIQLEIFSTLSKIKKRYSNWIFFVQLEVAEVFWIWCTSWLIFRWMHTVFFPIRWPWIQGHGCRVAAWTWLLGTWLGHSCRRNGFLYFWAISLGCNCYFILFPHTLILCENRCTRTSMYACMQSLIFLIKW